MPEEASFAELYKKLLDSNFDPDPERAGDALSAILHRLSFDSELDDAAAEDDPELSDPEADELSFDECQDPSDPIQEREIREGQA